MGLENIAAWITGPKVYPLVINPAPLGSPEAHQILVKSRAIAINPIDAKIQSLAIFPMKYPAIIGEDVAGDVVAVGDAVKRFEIGDRVIGIVAGHATKQTGADAFQAYTILHDDLACKIPDAMSFEAAVVLPLGITTAAAGLFLPDFLALNVPLAPAAPPNGQLVIIMGGASCVGSCAIQLLKAAGYDVIATASKRNFSLINGLGASQVFDYSETDMAVQIVAFLQKSNARLVGIYDAIGGASLQTAVDIASKISFAGMVATTLPLPKSLSDGINVKQVQALDIMNHATAQAVWVDFLPQALTDGTFECAPAPLVAGHGLESIQAAMDLQSKGMSAQKVVVKLG